MGLPMACPERVFNNSPCFKTASPWSLRTFTTPSQTQTWLSFPSSTEELKEVPRIPDTPDRRAPVIIATGPLTSDTLSAEIARLVGQQHLYFYDAISPIVLAESIDRSRVFAGSRYGRDTPDADSASSAPSPLPSEPVVSTGDIFRANIVDVATDALIVEVQGQRLHGRVLLNRVSTDSTIWRYWYQAE